MLNKVMIIGNVTRDPECKQTNGGTSVAKMGLAINRKFKNANGEKQEEVTFVDVDIWGKSAEFCRDYIRKGNRVLIEGRLKMDQWDDRTTGQKRSRLGVTAENVQSLTPRDQGQQQGNQGGGEYQASQQHPQEQAYQQQAAGNAAPPPPPFPTQAAGAPQGTPAGNSRPPVSGASTPGHENFNSNESIDDIPF